MVDNINNLNPNMGSTAEAMSGNSAMIFTAADRKILEERGVNLEKKISFKEAIMQNKDQLVAIVENEQTPIQPQVNVSEIQKRREWHKDMIEKSPYAKHKDKGQNTQEEGTEEQADSQSPVTFQPPPNEAKKIDEKTIALAAELKLDAKALMEVFALDDEELHKLILRIKNLHLQRLLSEDPKKFETLTHNIKDESLTHTKPEAKDWMTEKLKELTQEAAKYKVGFLKSMQAMDFIEERENSIKAFSKFL